MPETNLLTLDEAARRLGVRPTTLSRWIRKGRVPAYRLPSGSYRIAEEDLVLALAPAHLPLRGKDRRR